MILNTPEEIKSYQTKQAGNSPLNFDRILMVQPDHYDIKYAINPYMQTPDGKLKTVDRSLAQKQWKELASTFQRIGFRVDTISATPELPDMVYAANQIFPFWDAKLQKKRVICSQMRSPYRQPEVAYFKKYLEANGYDTVALSDKKLAFEGNGDALIQPSSGLVWGAFGPRTDRAVYDELSEKYLLDIVCLKLVTSDFYHLDTCFAILNKDTVAYQKEAFSVEDQKKIEAGFTHTIPIDYDENLRFFAGNCFCPNGVDVILQKGSAKFVAQLKMKGFKPIEVDTSEFIKGGGSVFCLKMAMFGID